MELVFDRLENKLYSHLIDLLQKHWDRLEINQIKGKKKKKIYKKTVTKHQWAFVTETRTDTDFFISVLRRVCVEGLELEGKRVKQELAPHEGSQWLDHFVIDTSRR